MPDDKEQEEQQQEEQSGDEQATALLNPDGTFSETFFDSIPEEHTELRAKADKLKGLPDVYSALKKMIHAEGMIGANTVKLPGDNATEEEIAAFHKALGVPAEAKDYGLVKPDDWPEDIPLDENLIKGFAELAKKIGLPPAQAKGIYDWYLEQGKAQDSSFKEYSEQEKAKGMEELRKLPGWGADTEKKIEKIQHLTGFLTRGFEAEVIKELDEGLGNNPALLRMMDNMVKIVSEKRIEGALPENALAQQSLREQLDKIVSDPYYMAENPHGKTPNRALHRQLVARALSLRERIKAIEQSAT